MFLTFCSPIGLEAEGQALLDFVCDVSRDADAAGICQLLDPGRDVDALAIAVLALDDDFAEIDADPDLDALIWRKGRVALGKSALQRDGAFDGIHHGAELGQHTVAHHLEDPAVMARDLGLEQIFPASFQPFMRAGFVGFHERRIGDNVGSQNGGKLAVHGKCRPQPE